MIAQIERVSRHMNTPDTSAQDNGRRPVVVAVASGKGGVGKTHVPVNVAVSLARGGKRVMLFDADLGLANAGVRSEEHTSELQSLMRTSYVVLCLKKKKQ